MLDYIKHDACEKIYEIETKMEEDFIAARRQAITKARNQMDIYYAEAEKQELIRSRM